LAVVGEIDLEVVLKYAVMYYFADIVEAVDIVEVADIVEAVEG